MKLLYNNEILPYNDFDALFWTNCQKLVEKEWMGLKFLVTFLMEIYSFYYFLPFLVANYEVPFYNIDYLMFREMLINQNTNECRSTYYPHETWTVYQPDRFKTWLIKDIKKVKEMVKTLKGNKSMSSFTPAMYDYRNLLNFRILDGLNTRNLLKAVHKSKI